LSNRSIESIERCLSVEPPILTVKRNRRTGRICSAQFLPLARNSAALEGNETLRKTAHMGQHYSYAAAVDEAGHKSWRFVDFLFPADLRLELDAQAAVEAYLQSVFRAVPLSCLCAAPAGDWACAPSATGAVSAADAASAEAAPGAGREI